jgi:hypothetical protein
MDVSGNRAAGGAYSNFQLDGGSYGGIGAGYVGQDWASQFAQAQGIIEQYSQECGRAVSQQNGETEQIIGKMRQLTDAKAALVELLGKFGVPGDKDDKDPPLSGQSGYEDALKSLNDSLAALKMDPIDNTIKKSELESLQARLNGENEACSGRQGILSSRLNGWLNKFQSCEQLLTNMVRLMGSIWNAYAKNAGSS